jgi:hypothetical protein
MAAEILSAHGITPKSMGDILRAISNQVGSFYPQRENFHLTHEVKAKSTEKLKFAAKHWIFRVSGARKRS